MNKLALMIFGVLVGFVVGILMGYAIFKESKPVSSVPASKQYYYRLTDTTAVRHTIGASDSGMVHRIDTIAVLNRGW